MDFFKIHSHPLMMLRMMALILLFETVGAVFTPNGNVSEDGQFPWVVSFKRQCTACLIHPQWILTVAHCFKNEEDCVGFPAYLGYTDLRTRPKPQPGREIINATACFRPDGYNGNPKHDMALIKLEKPVMLSPYVQPIAISTPDIVFNVTHLLPAMIVGYGYPNYNTLKSIDAEVLYNEPKYKFKDSRIRAYTYNGTPCLGDSGGPLIVRHDNGTYYQLGILHGIYSSCAYVRRSLNTFIKVSYFASWIQDKIDNN